MREILFRGKNKVTGEMIQGNLYQHGDQCFIMANNRNTEVFPETVGQYTGLTDKNDVKIFEGDIVKYGDTLHKVVFCNIADNAYFGIWFVDRSEIWGFSPSVSANRMTVIGNIYDNPELVKE